MSDLVDTRALAALLRPAFLRLNRQLRREALVLGVSPQLPMLLATIANEPGIGVNDLAARENMRASSMSQQIKQLEEAGYLQRDPSLHADKRRVGLSVTPKALQLIDDVRKLRTDWLAKRVDMLSEADRQALADALPALQKLGG